MHWKTKLCTNNQKENQIDTIALHCIRRKSEFVYGGGSPSVYHFIRRKSEIVTMYREQI